MKKAFFSLLLLILIPVLCYSKSVNVITSVFPLKLYLQGILPENFKVESVIPVNSDPHIFEPTPETTKKIEKADIFIGVQKDFDGWIEKLLPSKAKVLFINKPKANPHIWLSPRIMLSKVDFILQSLKIESNKAATFKKRLKSLISRIQKSTQKPKQVFEVHPAWDYFLKDAGIEVAGVLIKSGHTEISIKNFVSLIKVAKEKNVKVIICSKNIYAPFVCNFKKEIKGKVIKLSPLGLGNETDYIEFLSNLYRSFFSSL